MLEKLSIDLFQSGRISKPTISQAIKHGITGQLAKNVDNPSNAERNPNSKSLPSNTNNAINESKSSTSLPSSLGRPSANNKTTENNKKKEGEDSKSKVDLKNRIYKPIISLHPESLQSKRRGYEGGAPDFQLGFTIDAKDYELYMILDDGTPVYTRDPNQVYFEKHQHHFLICGMSGVSGKTTFMESIVARWPEKKVLAIITKKGEEQFKTRRRIRPFFKVPQDYASMQELVGGLIPESPSSIREAAVAIVIGSSTVKELVDRLDMAIAKYSNSSDFHEPERRGSVAGIGNSSSKVEGMTVGDTSLLQEKAADLQSIQQQQHQLVSPAKMARFLVALKHLHSVLSQLMEAGCGDDDRFELHQGIMVMDLTDFDRETQSIIIASVTQEILDNHENTVLAIPEVWQFLPTRGSSRVSRPLEELARKGRVRGNFVCLDSQDLASVPSQIRKQMGHVLVGRQQDAGEIKRALDLMAGPEKEKPKPEDIRSLKFGQFYMNLDGKPRKILAHPCWMEFDDVFFAATGLNRQIRFPGKTSAAVGWGEYWKIWES